MNGPVSVNGVRTRVVHTDEGMYEPQFSADGLNWFPIRDSLPFEEAARGECEAFVVHSNRLPKRGVVVAEGAA